MMQGIRKTFGIVLAIAALGTPASAQIVGSPHNLSASGPGPVKAFGEQEVCIFCHTPHNASPSTPLWNRSSPALVYTLYTSSTLQAEARQPSDASKLCLSCHDGTIGLGSVLSRPSPISMSGTLSARTNLTTDLSDDHPVSFVYDSALAAADQELADPSFLTGEVKLDAQGQMQCTSCHDAHSSPHPKFLLLDPAFSPLCMTCHDKAGWTGSSHQTSPATWNGAGVDPWPHTEQLTVSANGCESCHAPHAAGAPERLLTFFAEEDNCLSCHNGNVARLDIDSELRKPFTHPVDAFLGVHDPGEDPDFMPRHVECEDCHNPHAASAGQAAPPNVSGPLTGAAGVSSSGAAIENANFQYEVCFRCHSDNANVPAPSIVRQVFQPSLRMKFDLSNPSFHPVEGSGRNPDVPSLIAPWSESSLLYCTDCHASDNGPGAGGSGARGPHGSNWQFLLEREYRTADDTSESFQAYSLCYKCHDRTSILNDDSFKEHKKHIEGERAPCSVCHDPHGISSAQGSATNHAHLINFDTSIVQPNPQNGALEFVDLGFQSGECSLLCHGKRHRNQRY